MGYRSNGYFIIPAEYSAELDRSVKDYLVEEEKKRIKDKKVADDAGKHYMYGNTKPWNPLTGFDFITLMEDSKGNQYHKYGIEGWKWYQGSDFPKIVDELLNFISSKGKLAIFALQGEDWDDTTVEDSTGIIERVYELAGNPWDEDSPQILVMVNHEGPASDIGNYQEVLDKLTALEPTESGDLVRDMVGIAINAPTMVNIFLVRDPQYFYWSRSSMRTTAAGFKKIKKILTDFETKMEDTIGFAVMMDGYGDFNELEINGTSYEDYDVWPQSGWDDTGLDLEDIKEIPIKDIHKI